MSFRFLLLKPLVILAVIITLGTIGYMSIEKWSFLDALFMSVETLTTVGYGIFNDISDNGRIFTIIYILFGVILFLYLAADFAEKITSLDFQTIINKRNMEKKLKNLKNHYILCGYGRTGVEIASQLIHSKLNFVVIDKDPSLDASITEKDICFITGDATDDNILEKAGIKKAKGLLCALSDDVDNLYLTLSARNLNPDMKIVTRCIKASNESKFLKAGASNIILPYEISGKRMVTSVIKPEVADFLDVVMHTKGHDLELKMEQFCLNAGSAIENKTIANSGIKDKTGVIIIAIKRDGEYITSPSANEFLKANDCLIILGTTRQLNSFENYAGNK